MTHRRELFEAAVLKGLLALPTPAQKVLAGRPVVRDGQRLSTEMQLMLRLQRLARVPALEDLPWEQGRAELARQARMVGGRQPIGSVRDLTIEGPGGPLPLRLYTPASALRSARVPTMLFLHGGGMVHGGGHAAHEQACRHLAEHSGVQLLSVDYRLAPEHPFPAAVEDCLAAYAWLVEHAAEVDADPDRLAVGGDSAGGYLSATTAIQAAERGLPMAFQLLIYPCTDFVDGTASQRMFSERFFLTKAFIDLASGAFFPDEAARRDSLGSVGLRDSFPAGLAPAYVVTAGFDPLRDEGEAYARLLAEHGVEVEAKRYPSMIHGFFNIVGVGREASSYNVEIAELLGQRLGGGLG
ncbi:alpha/beta hydrolase [Nocardioides terrisoli]|uniref:alpha/beta hydrolase n=1 Tax=Nocardioides terrisoli TaxID=3388267 RepID=UPI00287B858B|nr:alpha/beta hydrolase [Nocardioides marmorisolisilvae]